MVNRRRNFEVLDIVKNMLKFFQMEQRLKRAWCIKSPVSRISRATGIHKNTIIAWLKKNETRSDPVQDVVKSIHLATAQKPVPDRQKLDDFDKGVVRRTVYEMHQKSHAVTMPALQQALKEKDIVVSVSTVARTVKQLGFRFYKNASERRFITERPDIVQWRHTYLRKIRKFRQQGRNIVYLDESWLNTNHVIKGDWLDVPSTSMSVFEPHCKGSSRKIPTGKGTRLIILDAGYKGQGLIPGCGLNFESKTNSQDYHDEMNKEHFTEWFKDTLLPRLPPQSVVVMDNAPYHSHLDPEFRVPTKSAKKSDISAWLEKNNVRYDKKMNKAELSDLVSQNKPRPKYVIDGIASAHGHEVLRLPPYHCELNPIEMVWSNLKGFVASRNTTCKKSDCIKLFKEAKSHFDGQTWDRYESHVIREYEEKLWQMDGLRDEDVPRVAFTVTDDSDTDDSQRTIPYCVSEGEGDDLENDDDLDDISDFIDPAGEVLCNTCGNAEPPKSIRKDKHIDWFHCDMCDRWVHNRCSTKPALARNVCLRCFSILNHRDLSQPLILPPEDMEQ